MKYMSNKIFLYLALFWFNQLQSIQIEIVAKVNNQIITNIDIENRLNLALQISKIPNDTEIKKQLKKQILKVLIDETLKIQEAESLGIFISSTEVNDEINRLENKLNIEPNSLIQSYKKKNIPEIVIYDQIRSQLLWNKLVSIAISSNIKVTEKQKEETFQNFIKTSGETEYNTSEIFVSFSSNNNNFSAKEKIDSIHNKINISNFMSMAEQFSDGAVNIENWTRESMLNEDAKKVIENLNIGNISVPFKSSMGYHIFLLNDKRNSKKIIENETLFNLSQIFFKFTDNKEKDLPQFRSLLNNLRSSIKGCDNLDNSIKNIKESSGGNLGLLSENALDKRFSSLIKKGLPVGILSKDIITEDGLHSIMLCEPFIKVNYDDIKKNLENRIRLNKINNGANLLLNRIRQKALIEIKPI